MSKKQKDQKRFYILKVRDVEGKYVGVIKFYLQSEKVEEFDANYIFVNGMLIILANVKASIGEFVHIKSASHDVRSLINQYYYGRSCTIKLEQEGFSFDEEDFRERAQEIE